MQYYSNSEFLVSSVSFCNNLINYLQNNFGVLIQIQARNDQRGKLKKNTSLKTVTFFAVCEFIL